MTPSDNYFTISPHNLAPLRSTLLHSYPVHLTFPLRSCTVSGKFSFAIFGGRSGIFISCVQISKHLVFTNKSVSFKFCNTTLLSCSLNLKFYRRFIIYFVLLSSLLLLLVIWQSPGLPGWRKVNLIIVTHRSHHASIAAGLYCLTTSPGLLPALCEKWSGFFYVHRVLFSYIQ